MQINKCTGAGLGDLLDVPGHCHVAYHHGVNHVATVVRRGLPM